MDKSFLKRKIMDTLNQNTDGRIRAIRTLDVDPLLMADGKQSLGYCFDQLHRHLASLVVPMRGVSKDHSEVAEKVEL